MEARKDPGEYWRSVMKEQPMPEAIQGLIVHSNSVPIPSDQEANYTDNQLFKAFKHKCEQSSTKAVKDTNLKKSIVEDFEPRPSTIAHDGDDNGARSKNNFVEDFESRPNVSAYDGDDNGARSKKNFVKDFEPRPNVSAYDEDDGARDKKKITNDFEPRPNVSAYDGDDTDATGRNEFVEDFEPRPNVSVYNE
ncbi:Organ specific protein [Quillaja saponaria]|uniref:Organ specific protein n=1 Tax=Quillaja saponaria TaxID=32244 RepID=A0AAD7LPX5_QUISA|nr:Organ specific protein [Quillaja saponaria]